MCVASTSALPYIENDALEGIIINAAALPAYKTNDQLYYGTNITVFNTGSKEQKQAAWDFIKFLTNTENTAYFAAQTGYIPCAGQPSMPRYLLLFWRKNLSNSFALIIWITGSREPGISEASMRWMLWANSWTWYSAEKRIWTAPEGCPGNW